MILLNAMVAPVTNWRFYDSIYRTRYMQTPQENQVDMMKIHLLIIEVLKENFLIHGSGDDNVYAKLNANDGSFDSSKQTV
jgi:dipeptidyl-peptidase-4